MGGAELQAERWAAILADRHRVTVVTRGQRRGDGHDARDGFEVTRVPLMRAPALRSPVDVARTVRAVADVSPRPDILLCFQTFISGLAGVRATARVGIPAVIWVRGENEYRLARGRMRWIAPAVWRGARGVLVQSEFVRTQLLVAAEQRAKSLREDLEAKLEIVPNGLDLPPGPFPPGNGVLAVGRLVPQKEMGTVMDAAAAAGQALTIAGDGPERAALEARESAANTKFEGILPRDRLALLYREAGCVVLASSSGEGLPNALLEAMSFARPVIATPIAGVHDLVRDGENGLLVSPGDATALAAAIRRLDDDPALAARLGAAARTTAEGFGWDAARARLEPLLERWASRPTQSRRRGPRLN